MFGSGRLFRKLDSKVTNLVLPLGQSRCKGTVKSELLIPPRIERESTDILKALASTVEVDPTAFHYKYIDDPHFYPYSVGNKRVFALSKESGKNSAEWIIKENPGFFKHKLADPPIEAFLLKNKNEIEVEFTERELLNAIEERDVLSAVQAYKTVKSKSEDIQASTKQSLLELLCFYNEEEKPNEGLEERWFKGFLGRAGANVSDLKKWNHKGLAVTLFEEMDPMCPLATSAIILGLIKYNEIHEAMQLIETAKTKQIKLTVDVYNALIENSGIILEERREVYPFIRNLLLEMAKQQIKPNLGTLNGVLNALHGFNYSEVSLKVVKEFLHLNIEPSLGTYGYLFVVISKAKNPPDPIFYRNVITDLMNYIENREHEILHPSDLKFFVNAMIAFTEGLRDIDLVLRLHKMYLKPSSRKFIVRGGDDHGFYKMAVKFIFQTQPIDFAMDFYRRYKLTVFTPESSVLKEMISAMHRNFSSEYLPELWKDLPALNYERQRPILKQILNMSKDFSDELSLDIFYEIGIAYFKFLLSQKSPMREDQDALPVVLSILVKKDDANMLQQVLDFIEDKNYGFINMEENILKSVFDYAIKKENVSLIRGSLNLASREHSALISEMVEKALPYLDSSDAFWAETLVPGNRKAKRLETEEKDGSKEGDAST